MSDYIPNPPPERDPRFYDRYDEQSSGRGIGLVVGILVAIGLVAGLMFFTGPRDHSTDVAQNPANPSITRTAPDQATVPPLPTARPANPVTPPAAAPAEPKQ
jgi:hypothetical protein